MAPFCDIGYQCAPDVAGDNACGRKKLPGRAGEGVADRDLQGQGVQVVICHKTIDKSPPKK